MAKKFLDSEGLGIVWGKVKAEDLKIKNALTAEIDKKANSADVYNKTHIDTELGKKLDASKVGEAYGVAPLDDNRKLPTECLPLIPTGCLPSYVDDVLEYKDLSTFPTTGEAGKIYVAMDTNKTYRWGGSAYAEISSSLALGETSSTAYPGDKGKANADNIKKLTESLNRHTSNKDNPHGVTKEQVGLGNVDNTSDADKPISTATQAELDKKISNEVVEVNGYRQTIANIDSGIYVKSVFDDNNYVLLRTYQHAITFTAVSDTNALFYELSANNGFIRRKTDNIGNKYHVLDESMALSESELNAILV